MAELCTHLRVPFRRLIAAMFLCFRLHQSCAATTVSPLVEISRETLSRNIPMCSLYSAKTDMVLRHKAFLPTHTQVPQDQMPSNEVLANTTLADSDIVGLATIQKHIGASASLMLSFIAGRLKGLSGIGKLLDINHDAGQAAGVAKRTIITIGSSREIRVNGSCRSLELSAPSGTRATHLVSGISYGVRSVLVCSSYRDRLAHERSDSLHFRKTNVHDAQPPAEEKNETCVYFGDVSHAGNMEKLRTMHDVLKYIRVKPEYVRVKVSPVRLHLSPLPPSDFVEEPNEIAKTATVLKDRLVSVSQSALRLQNSFSRHGGDNKLSRIAAAIAPVLFTLPQQLALLWRDLVQDALFNGLRDLRTSTDNRFASKWRKHYEMKLHWILREVEELLLAGSNFMTLQQQVIESELLSRLADSVSRIKLIGESTRIILDGVDSIGTDPLVASLEYGGSVIVLVLNILDNGLINTLDLSRDYSKLLACNGSFRYLQTLAPKADIQSTIARFWEYKDLHEHNDCKTIGEPQNLLFAIYLTTTSRQLKANESVARIEKWDSGVKDENFDASRDPCTISVVSLTVSKEDRDDFGVMQPSFRWHLPQEFQKYVRSVRILQKYNHGWTWVDLVEQSPNSSVFTLKKPALDAIKENENSYSFEMWTFFHEHFNKSETHVRFYCPRYFNGDVAECSDKQVDPTWEVCKKPSCPKCLKPLEDLQRATELKTLHPKEQVIFISAAVIVAYADTGTNTAYFAFYENCLQDTLSDSALLLKLTVEQLQTLHNVSWNAEHCGYWNTDVHVSESWTVCFHCRGETHPVAQCFSLTSKTKIPHVNANLWDPVYNSLRRGEENLIPETLSKGDDHASFCYFASATRSSEDFLFVTCQHCVDVTVNEQSQAKQLTGFHFCVAKRVLALNEERKLVANRSFDWNNATHEESQQYEPFMNITTRNFIVLGIYRNGPFSGSENGLANQRHQRNLYGRIVSATASGDLLLAGQRFASGVLANYAYNLEPQPSLVSRPACQTESPCRRIINYQTFHLNQSHSGENCPYQQSASGCPAIPVSTFQDDLLEGISADSFFQASERSIASDELGNVALVVVRMDRLSDCNTVSNSKVACEDACVLKYSHEVYLHNPVTNERKKISQYFPDVFSPVSCAEELEHTAGFSKVQGQHALWINRGYIYLRLGKLAENHKLFKLKYLHED